MLPLAAFLFLFWVVAAINLARGNRRLRSLATVAASAPAQWPRVSIVFAARNEGATVGAAVPTMLQLDYPDFEIIAVDDRSDDATGPILDDLAAREPRLRVEHVRVLPSGWLGKTHALHRGAARATGEWILFTDADIHFRADTLRRAVAAAEADRLDFLAAVPGLTKAGGALGIAVNAFSLLYTLALQPWRIPNPRSWAHAGVGAFNFVRADKYREIGGHESIRLRPDDDVKFARVMKRRGGRCEFMHGLGAIAVEWYPDLPSMVRGLEKNSYAGSGYQPWAPTGGAVVQAVLFFWPALGLIFASGPAWWLHAGATAALVAVGCDQVRFTGGRWWYGVFLPFGIAVIAYALLRAMVITHWTGGIRWRGTFYPLAELRKNKV